MQEYSVATIPGDGIGPEVMTSAKMVLEAISEINKEIAFNFLEYPAGDECKRVTGDALPPETLEGVKGADACLFSAVGETAKEVILPLRQQLNLYANLRPSKTFPGVESIQKNVDIVVVRENSEGLYKMIGHRGKNFGVNLRIITREASDKIARYAFEYAKKNDREKVTSVHKVNVMDFSEEIFLESTRKVSRDFPEIKYTELIVDACAMKLVLEPEKFEVIITTNMFGDILSDEIAGLVGGLGLAPSANIGDKKAIFEPVHGSAPDIAGKNIANPIAMILSSGMMLNWLNQKKAAKVIEYAITNILKEGQCLTPDLGGNATTQEMTEEIIKNMKKVVS